MHLYRSVVFPGLLRFVLSLEVTPNSACGSLCDKNIAAGADPSNADTKTYTSDLVCNDYEYDGSTSTESGHRFKDCLTCELKSTATDANSNESDVYWALFHMKFTLAWCLFAFPDNNDITVANHQCADICSGPENSMKPALIDQLLDGHYDSTYLYCTDGNGAFSRTTDGCRQCLKNVPNSEVLIKFLDALNVACDQRPSPEKLLQLDFDVFPSVSNPALNLATPFSETPAAVTSSPETSSTETSSTETSSTETSSTEISSIEASFTETSSPGTSSTENFSAGISGNFSSQAFTTAKTNPLYPPPSFSATIAVSNTSVTTSFTPAASSSAPSTVDKSQNNVVRIGVGVGVGLGGTAALSVAAGILIWWWRQHDLKRKDEAHERHKKDLRIRHLQDGQTPDEQIQDDESAYSRPELEAFDIAPGPDVISQTRSLRLSNFIVEDDITPRTTQRWESNFIIEAEAVLPMRESVGSGFIIER